MSNTEEILTQIQDMIDAIADNDPYTMIDIDQLKLDDLYKIQNDLEDLYEILEGTAQSIEDLIEDMQDKIDDLEEQNDEPQEDE